MTAPDHQYKFAHPIELEGRSIEQCVRHAEQLQRMLDAEMAVSLAVQSAPIYATEELLRFSGFTPTGFELAGPRP